MKRKRRRGGSSIPAAKRKQQSSSKRTDTGSQTLKHTTPVPPAIPGEFEHQEALVFGASQLIRHCPQLFADFVKISFERIKLIGILDTDFRELADLLLGAAGLPQNAVEFVEGKTSSVWARDWSPFMGYTAEGKRCQYYVNRGHMRHRDDQVSRTVFEQRFDDAAVEIPVNMEGGNFLSNGCGLMLTSFSVPHTNSTKYSHQELARIFETTLGCNQWAALSPLHAERTGHVDLFATFLAPDFLLLGSVDEKQDEINFRSLNDIEEKLKGLATPHGKLRVERIPMPSSSDSNFRSYNNVIFANDLLFVPIYPKRDPILDQRVLGMYREFVPDRHVIGVDMRQLAEKGGGLHCLSVNIPPANRVPLPLPVKVA